jgi:phosphoribosyl 1,2-cyclic phosphodiesterase
VRGSIPTSLTTADIRDRLVYAFYMLPNPPRDRNELAAAIDRFPFYIRGTFGGCTTCIEVDVNGSPIILDTGTGARPLGISLLKRLPKDRTIHILQTHCHWDHIQGWPFFLPAYDPTCTIHIHSLFRNLKELFDTQQQPNFCPVKLKDLPAKIEFHTLAANKPAKVGPATVTSIMLGHPAGTCGYRITAGKRTVVLMTDVELLDSPKEKLEEYRKFADKSDLAIVDSQYGEEDVKLKASWGHSYIGDFVDLFRDLDVKRLCLFHYEPSYPDAVLEALADEAREHAERLDPKPKFEVVSAWEGLRIAL